MSEAAHSMRHDYMLGEQGICCRRVRLRVLLQFVIQLKPSLQHQELFCTNRTMHAALLKPLWRWVSLAGSDQANWHLQQLAKDSTLARLVKELDIDERDFAKSPQALLTSFTPSEVTIRTDGFPSFTLLNLNLDKLRLLRIIHHPPAGDLSHLWNQGLQQFQDSANADRLGRFKSLPRVELRCDAYTVGPDTTFSASSTVSWRSSELQLH